MENILTFETGLLVGGLLIMLTYAFVAAIALGWKIKSLNERLSDLVQKTERHEEEHFRYHSDIERQHWESLNELERRLDNYFDNRMASMGQDIQNNEKKIADCQKEYDQELSVFDKILSDLRTDIKDIRRLVGKFVPAQEEKMINS